MKLFQQWKHACEILHYKNIGPFLWAVGNAYCLLWSQLVQQFWWFMLLTFSLSGALLYYDLSSGTQLIVHSAMVTMVVLVLLTVHPSIERKTAKEILYRAVPVVLLTFVFKTIVFFCIATIDQSNMYLWMAADAFYYLWIFSFLDSSMNMQSSFRAIVPAIRVMISQLPVLLIIQMGEIILSYSILRFLFTPVALFVQTNYPATSLGWVLVLFLSHVWWFALTTAKIVWYNSLYLRAVHIQQVHRTSPFS